MNAAFITTAELKGALQGANPPVLLDCRFNLAAPEEGRQLYTAGHASGAVYVDLNLDLSAAHQPGVTGRHPLPSLASLEERVRAWGISADDHVICYDDQGGVFAARAWWLLRSIGLARCQVLDGGYSAYVDAGLNVDATVVHRSPSDFKACPNNAWWVSAEHVVAQLREAPLIDARGATRFLGEEEPIDPIAGRIPGAVNLPFQELLEGNHVRSPSEIEARFRALLDGADCTDAIVYCGSGVTACLLILTAEHAGLGRPRLYAGSWSDWIIDPRRPVAKGPVY